jgi:hypothetical protein
VLLNHVLLLIQDAVAHVLELVVLSRAPRVERTRDQRLGVCDALALREIHCKSLFERVNHGLTSLQTGQTRARQHNLDQGHDALLMFAHLEEALDKYGLEVAEGGTLRPAHQINVLARQFERRRFEVESTGRVPQHEAVVDVDQMSLLVEHDVAVVTVFDLQQVAHDGIARQAVHELFHCLAVARTVRRSVALIGRQSRASCELFIATTYLDKELR